MRILFCKTGHMKYYKGVTAKDKLKNGGLYVQEHQDGGEAYNFAPVKFPDGNEYCFGFFETKSKDGYKSGTRISNQLHIEKIDASSQNEDELDDVLVIWCATRDTNDLKIVGWYQHATVFRHYQSLEFENGYTQDYNVCAAKKDCVLLPYEEQNRHIWDAVSSRKKDFGFGQSLVWYANEEAAQDYVQQIVDQINRYQGDNYIDIDENNDPAEKKRISILD